MYFDGWINGELITEVRYFFFKDSQTGFIAVFLQKIASHGGESISNLVFFSSTFCLTSNVENREGNCNDSRTS